MKMLIKIFLTFFLFFSSFTSVVAVPPPPTSSLLIFIPPIIAAANQDEVSTYWGTFAELSCPTSALTFSVTSEGITKSSICQPGQCLTNNPGTFEGWVGTTPGTKQFIFQMNAPGCGTGGDIQDISLEADTTYRFRLIYGATDVEIVISKSAGAPTNPRFGTGPLTNGRQDATGAIWEEVDRFSLNIPNTKFNK